MKYLLIIGDRDAFTPAMVYRHNTDDKAVCEALETLAGQTVWLNDPTNTPEEREVERIYREHIEDKVQFMDGETEKVEHVKDTAVICFEVNRQRQRKDYPICPNCKERHANGYQAWSELGNQIVGAEVRRKPDELKFSECPKCHHPAHNQGDCLYCTCEQQSGFFGEPEASAKLPASHNGTESDLTASKPVPSGVRWEGRACGCRWRVAANLISFIPCGRDHTKDAFQRNYFPGRERQITDPAELARLEAEWQKGQGGK